MSALDVNKKGAVPPKYTVFSMPSAGMLFEVIKRTLIERGDWEEVTPPSLKEIKAANASAFVGAGSGTGARMCCSKLLGTNVFMGEKLLTEKLVGEARLLTARCNRKGSAPIIKGDDADETTTKRTKITGLRCTHTHPILDVPAAPPSVHLVNYYEGTRCITLKSRMIKTMLEYFKRGGAGPTFPPELFDGLRYSANSPNQIRGLEGQRLTWEFIPETYTLIPAHNGMRDERDEMIDAMKTANDSDSSGVVSTWIAKSSHGCHGDGIKIVSATSGGLRELTEYIDGHNDAFAWVVCRYVDRPLLYNGRKFDLRVWVLVTHPFTIYCHRELVMRTSSVAYNRNTITTNTPEGLLANITNHCVQTGSTTYSQHEEGNELWYDTLTKLLQDTSGNIPDSSPPRDYGPAVPKANLAADVKVVPKGQLGSRETPEDKVMLQIHQMVVHCLLATQKKAAQEGISPSVETARPKMSGDVPVFDVPEGIPNVENFQMFGFDFIIDQWQKVWLLEVNGSPGVADRLIQKIVDDTIELVIDPKYPCVPGVGSNDKRLKRATSENGFVQLYPSPGYPNTAPDFQKELSSAGRKVFAPPSMKTH